jgi:hypothetical protein
VTTGLQTDPPRLHFEPPRPPLWAQALHALQLQNFDFVADPDPAFASDANPDAASQNYADPDPLAVPAVKV